MVLVSNRKLTSWRGRQQRDSKTRRRGMRRQVSNDDLWTRVGAKREEQRASVAYLHSPLPNRSKVGRSKRQRFGQSRNSKVKET
jgi:hypothetical protein